MTREDVRRCFPGASEAQVTALLKMHGAEVRRARRGAGRRAEERGSDEAAWDSRAGGRDAGGGDGDSVVIIDDSIEMIDDSFVSNDDSIVAFDDSIVAFDDSIAANDDSVAVTASDDLPQKSTSMEDNASSPTNPRASSDENLCSTATPATPATPDASDPIFASAPPSRNPSPTASDASSPTNPRASSDENLCSAATPATPAPSATPPDSSTPPSTPPSTQSSTTPSAPAPPVPPAPTAAPASVATSPAIASTGEAAAPPNAPAPLATLSRDELLAELTRRRADDAQRHAEQRERERLAALETRFDAAVGARRFIHPLVREGIFASFVKAASLPQNASRPDALLLDDLTRGETCFRSMNPPPEMGCVSGALPDAARARAVMGLRLKPL